MIGSTFDRLIAACAAAALAVISIPMTAAELFPTETAGETWREFSAEGYSEPVCGVIYRSADTVTNGMPLGTIDTGCLDLESNGTFGFSTIFNTHTPQRGGSRVRTPALALSVGGKTWALCRSTASAPETIPLAHVAEWLPADLGLGQPAWAVHATGVPGWAKSIGCKVCDIPAGRVFCHNPTVLRWTSPVRDEIEIQGGMWVCRNIGRVQKWELRHNGVRMTDGRLAWGPTSAAPQPYSSGSGGDAGLRAAVEPGDRIELVLERAEVCEDFVGVDFSIVAKAAGKKWDAAAEWSDAQNPNGPWTYDDARKRQFDLFASGAMPNVHRADEVHYWGHYPVVDIEYRTGSPVQVGLRAWSSFLPGSLVESMIPGAVFETHLRNTSAASQSGSIVLNFPGWSNEEAGANRFERRQISGEVRGVEVVSPLASYAVGALGGEVRVGSDLGLAEANWTSISTQLPAASESSAGTSVAVDFSLAAGEEKVVRFVLAWCATQWKGGGAPTAGGANTFSHMYARHYPSAAKTAELLAARHADLLSRILAWQQVVYSEKKLPVWLRDALINNLYMITETGLWAQAKAPLGEWCRAEDGLFGMIECPRECPQIECIPCSFYGNLPLVYFFPQLALSTMRGYKAMQYPDGCVVWVFGPQCDFATPARPYQLCSSDVCMVEMIDKLWLCSGDDAILREFYDGAKRATIHAMNMRPEYGAKQVIAMPSGDKDTEWIEFVPLQGLVSHVGGVHLAQLRMAKRMADKMGDEEFSKQCDQWLAAGSESLEKDLWAGTHYLLYHELNSGKKSDVLMSCQLDGEWISRFHGLPGVFPADRVKTTLATMAKVSADPKLFPFGMKVFARADGKPLEGDFSYWRQTGTHSPSSFMLGMTYMYDGQREFGEDLVRRTVDYVFAKGNAWDFPLVWDVVDGTRYYGSDYYQNMMLWSMPAVLDNQDLAGPCQSGGLVRRVLQAAQPR
jgi:uncharacterized protein (DUF608 family)